MKAGLDLRCGRVDLDVGDLVRRAHHDHRRGLGAPSSAEHAIAAAKVSRSAFWAPVATEAQEDTDDSTLEVLVAVDASVLLEASKNDDGAGRAALGRCARSTCFRFDEGAARGLASLLEPYVGRPAAESMASMASVLLMVHLIRRYFLGRSLSLSQRTRRLPPQGVARVVAGSRISDIHRLRVGRGRGGGRRRGALFSFTLCEEQGRLRRRPLGGLALAPVGCGRPRGRRRQTGE